MKRRLFLLSILFTTMMFFSQCALLFVGVGVVGVSQLGKKAKIPSNDYNQVDTIWEETVEEITEEVETIETISEVKTEITDIDSLPKSDTNKVDRSIFPVDVLGGGEEENSVKITQLKTFEEEFDMGTIVYGDSVKHTFRYQNVGANDFVMEQYTVGCGCTEVSKPKKILKPGEMGEITLQFNSKEKDGPGDYTSDAMIIGNTPEGFLEFKIKVKVVAKE